jgi:hypothetical protein
MSEHEPAQRKEEVDSEISTREPFSRHQVRLNMMNYNGNGRDATRPVERKISVFHWLSRSNAIVARQFPRHKIVLALNRMGAAFLLPPTSSHALTRLSSAA